MQSKNWFKHALKSELPLNLLKTYNDAINTILYSEPNFTAIE